MSFLTNYHDYLCLFRLRVVGDSQRRCANLIAGDMPRAALHYLTEAMVYDKTAR